MDSIEKYTFEALSMESGEHKTCVTVGFEFSSADVSNRSQFCEVINLLLNIDLCRDRDRIVRANEPDCIVYSEGSGVQRPPQGRKHTRSKSVISGKAESKHCSPAAGFGMKAASTSLRHRAPG